MWACTIFAPHVDSSPSPDAAHLLGERVTVADTEETHFVISAAVDLRRVKGREGDVMTLRVRSAHHYSAGTECWVTQPRLHLTCGAAASTEVAWAACLPWLREQAAKIAGRATAPRMNIVYGAPAADPSVLLHALSAEDAPPPPHLIVHRRKLRSAVADPRARARARGRPKRRRRSDGRRCAL